MDRVDTTSAVPHDEHRIFSMGAVFLFVAGMGCELSANVIYHLLPLKASSVDETLSLCGIAMICTAAIVVLARLGPFGKAAYTGCLAAALILLSKLLDLTGSIASLNHVFLVGQDWALHKLAMDVTFLLGGILLLASYMLSAIEARTAHRELSQQNAALMRETVERRRLASAIEQSSEAVIITDASGVIQYVNPAFESLTGYSREEAWGRKTSLLKSGKHDLAFYRRLWDTLTQDGVWAGHFVNRRKDGSFFEEDCTISSVRDESGAVTNYIALKRDITARVTLERQLRHAQKMETVGSLAGRIAHDFNNILALILGHSEMALRRLAPDDPLHFNIEHIIKAGNRGSSLVKQILTFSRQVEQERRPVAIHTVVGEALDFLRVSLPATIRLTEDIRDCGLIFADPTQIHQVVINLCTNAYQAVGGISGSVEIGLKEHLIDPGFIADAGEPAPGSYVRLTVRDSGSGIETSVIPRIFDPFFSTKKPGEGTGLGLASVHGIVVGHGGAINVRSEVGHGTTFDVYFPRMESAPATLNSADEPLVSGSERILFVDDDRELAVLYRDALEQLGYVVTVCTSSLEALRLVQEQLDAFDVVITDHVMPDLTGAELAREILSARPRLPVILVTGFAQGISREQAKSAGISEYLMKPISVHALGAAIRRVLPKDEIPIRI